MTNLQEQEDDRLFYKGQPVWEKIFVIILIIILFPILIYWFYSKGLLSWWADLLMKLIISTIIGSMLYFTLSQLHIIK